MGRSKLDLPWPQGGTILGRVLDVLIEGGVEDCVIVTGGYRERVERIAEAHRVRLTHNPRYQTEQMLTSIEVGLRALETGPAAVALIMPADHPLVRVDTVTGLIAGWRKAPDRIWIPSHKRRRGHPILIPRALWPALILEDGERGLRSFLDHREDSIEHINVDDPGIRMDIDDPVSYEALRDEFAA
jgi:molybdenum cofactor cytidylyltransferase